MKVISDCMTLLKKMENIRFHTVNLKSGYKNKILTVSIKLLREIFKDCVIVSGIDDQFDADLASFISYANDNDGYKYLLVVIDIFSRYAWVEPIKDKTANEIVQAFNKIISEGRIPRRLRTDGATDFTSKKFQDYVKSKKIVHFTTHGVKQANYVERFIKTIKSKIYRYIVQQNTPRYIDILPKLVKSYNNSWHSGI